MRKRTFRIGTGIFGEGRPKVCVPIVAESQSEIWRRAERIAGLPVDMAEWRVDFYEDVFKADEVLRTLEGLSGRLGEKAILFTLRTGAEGGKLSVEEDAYYELNRAAAASGLTALVDMEAFLNEERTAGEIRRIHEAGGRVIASNHDFEKTPDTEEMVRRLARMEELGADAAKLAVMPGTRQDVLKLLQATVISDERLAVPVVTMSMGRLGVMSRLCGSLTGSAMTFAAVGESSAPGQIGAEQMINILKELE